MPTARGAAAPQAAARPRAGRRPLRLADEQLAVLLHEGVRRDLQVLGRGPLADAAACVVVAAMARAEPAAEVTGVGDGHAAQVRADAQHHEPAHTVASKGGTGTVRETATDGHARGRRDAQTGHVARGGWMVCERPPPHTQGWAVHTHHLGSPRTRSASFCGSRSDDTSTALAASMSAAVRFLMNTGLPRHLTVMVCPTATLPSSTSSDASARVSAAADMVDTNLMTARRAAEAYRKRPPPNTRYVKARLPWGSPLGSWFSL